MPGFKMTDIYPIFANSFSPKATATLQNKTHNLVHQYNEIHYAGRLMRLLGKLGVKTCSGYKDESLDLYVRRADMVRYVASRADKANLPKAIEKVIATVNHLADKDFTKASMVQLGVLELMPVDRPEPEYVVLSYITLTEKGFEYVQNNMPQMFVEEAGIPNRVEIQ